MSNVHVEQRLLGIQQILNGVHLSNSTMTSASKGIERQSFVDSLLAAMFSRAFRFGSGDVTDIFGQRSGQIDVVVEWPFMPSLPIQGEMGTRLYLAEGVAAAIEVKSNLAAQWDEVESTAKQLETVSRMFYGQTIKLGDGPPKSIPLFVVGYTGWKDPKTVKQKLAKNSNIAGILVIDTGIFFSDQAVGGFFAAGGPWGLWAMVCAIHHCCSSLAFCENAPFRYADPNCVS